MKHRPRPVKPCEIADPGALYPAKRDGVNSNGPECCIGKTKKMPPTLGFFVFVKYAKCPELLIP